MQRLRHAGMHILRRRLELRAKLAFSGPPNYYAATCTVLEPSGQPCQANNWCNSTNCRGGFCCSLTVPATCSECEFSYGRCKTCQSGYKLTNDYRCFPNDCKPSLSTQCTHCDFNGDCDACGVGYYVSAGNCLPQITTGSCTVSAMCTGGACRGGKCCLTTVASYRCIRSARYAPLRDTAKIAPLLGTTHTFNATR